MVYGSGSGQGKEGKKDAQNIKKKFKKNSRFEVLHGVFEGWVGGGEGLLAYPVL
jgi:hypothetical protein